MIDAGDRPWTSLVLVRHGETDWNHSGRVQGQADSALTERGLAQAEAVAGALAHEPIDLVFASDLARTRNTAAPLARALGLVPVLDARLRERAFGELQGYTWAEIEVKFPEAFRRLNARETDYRPPGGESVLDFNERVMSVMRDIAREAAGRNAVVVSHGGVVGIVYRFVREMPLDAKRDYALFNASINRFRVIDDRWHLDVWGDTSHLEGRASLDDFASRD